MMTVCTVDLKNLSVIYVVYPENKTHGSTFVVSLWFGEIDFITSVQGLVY